MFGDEEKAAAGKAKILTEHSIVRRSELLDLRGERNA
jgi:hypothetical protein